MKKFVDKLMQTLKGYCMEVTFPMHPFESETMIHFEIVKNTANQLAEEFAPDMNAVSKNKEVQCEEKMPEEKSKFSNEKLDAIMDKILDNQDLNKVSQEPKTRIEHIRSMSVEELADAILTHDELSTALNFCQNFSECCETILEEECRKCLIKWLNSSEKV